MLLFALLTALLSCTAAPEVPVLAQPPAGAHVQRIFIATQHGDITRFRNFGNPRQSETRFLRAEISVPPTHVPGRVETARKIDPAKHFSLVDAEEMSRDRFVRQLASEPAEFPTVGIFVHGYNTNLIKAGLRVAQIKTDFDVPFPLIAFAWPSSGEVRGYVYDRDSALFARDGLERLIRSIHGRTGRKVMLIAHSMGTLLTMETLRQMALQAPGDVARMVGEVVLASPDIDPDLFRRQIAPIAPLPDPFLVLSAEKDQALRLSSLLTGTRARLGALTKSPDLEARGITFLDVGSLAGDDPLGHNLPFMAPAAMLELLEQSERQF